LIDNVGIISQKNREKTKQPIQDKIKIFLKPKWQIKYKHLNNMRLNHARSQVRWRTRCNLIADWLKLYKLVAEWLCANLVSRLCLFAGYVVAWLWGNRIEIVIWLAAAIINAADTINACFLRELRVDIREERIINVYQIWNAKSNNINRRI
jgi:hypothetical protein